jgi:phosphoglycerol transferase MdoB-like AlkP superfamily enzyme
MSENKSTEKVVPIRKGDTNEEMVANYKNSKKEYSPLVATIRSVSVWVSIISTGILAFISILAIWTDMSNVVGRAWSTFVVVLFAAGFVSVMAPLLDHSEK